MLAIDWDDITADIIVLGKAISGGLFPLSCVLANEEIMTCIGPGLQKYQVEIYNVYLYILLNIGQHGSTFGGNPLGSAVGMAALEVLKEEKLDKNVKYFNFSDFL